MNQEVSVLNERIKELEKENEILKKEHIEISEAKELYLKIFEEFPALIWRSRLDKLCDYFNKTWLEFTGRSMEQEFGNGWAEGVHPDDFDFCLNTYVDAFDKREPFLMEYRMKNKLGEYRWIRDFGRPFYDLDNSFLGYIGSCYDITEIKDNEQRLIELNATKDKFFSIIAHDLKTPFSSIVGLSEYLAEEVDSNTNSEEISKLSGAIYKSSLRAMDLLTNLLTWSRLESGNMPFTPEYFDISDIIIEAISLVKSNAEKKSIVIENNVANGTQVYADKEMISTTLRNLLTNAVKFSEIGGKVTVTTTSNKNDFYVSVTDNGVGIPKERIDNLFTPGNISTPGTQNEKGTGLGLLLCKEFIEKNNGKIWVESTIGVGSAFHFTLQTNSN